MYREFFGLSKDPFAMTPDPSFLMLTSAHREALAGLSYAVLSRKGFVVLTGDAGTGKTTLLMRLIRTLPPTRAQFSVVLNSTLTPAEFLELALLDFGFADIPTSKAQRLMMLQNFLINAREQQKVPVLVVDEAHKLSPEVLEEIRLLTNFELPDGKLLQIVLAGQDELRQTLNRQDMRQLKQRIAVRVAIRHLSDLEVEEYIRYRWTKAGGQDQPFSPDAIRQIAHRSNAIPRLINAICDGTLTLAFGQGITSIGPKEVAEVAADLDLTDVYSGPGRNAMSRVSGNGTAAKLQIHRPTERATAVPSIANPVPILQRYNPVAERSDQRWWAKLGRRRGTPKL